MQVKFNLAVPFSKESPAMRVETDVWYVKFSVFQGIGVGMWVIERHLLLALSFYIHMQN